MKSIDEQIASIPAEQIASYEAFALCAHLHAELVKNNAPAEEIAKVYAIAKKACALHIATCGF